MGLPRHAAGMRGTGVPQRHLVEAMGAISPTWALGPMEPLPPPVGERPYPLGYEISQGSQTIHGGGGSFQRKMLDFQRRWAMSECTENWKTTEGASFCVRVGSSHAGHSVMGDTSLVCAGWAGLQQQFGTEREMHFPAGANSPLPVSCAPQPAPSRAQDLPCLTRPLSLTCLTAANSGLTSPLPCLHLAPLGTTVGTPSALKHPDWSPVVPKARTSPDLHWEGKPVSSQECQPGCLILLPMFVLQRPAPSPGEGWPA